MNSKIASMILAFVAVASAAPANRRQDDCEAAYDKCIAAGTPQVACSCTLTTCSGEDSARLREFCATATASLVLPTSTSIPGGCNPAHPGSCPSSTSSATFSSISGIPGGCNPAHPGSCPSSYFDTTKSATATFTSISGIPGGCNPAHPGSCPSSYFDTTESATATAAFSSISGIPGGCNPAHPGSCPSSYFDTTKSATPVATYTSVPGIPGGCNPAHPGSCPSSYFSTTAESSVPAATYTSIPGIPGGCNPAHPGSCPSSYFTYATAAAPTSVPTQAAGGYPSPTLVKGKSWSLKNLSRYCGEDGLGCDYNFEIETSDKTTERCTVIRMPGSGAATESWSNQPCTTGSEYSISWGYVADPAPAFAVVTVVQGKELAWFGVADVNGQEVTPSNPFGSGEYCDVDDSPVYTY